MIESRSGVTFSAHVGRQDVHITAAAELSRGFKSVAVPAHEQQRFADRGKSNGQRSSESASGAHNNGKAGAHIRVASYDRKGECAGSSQTPLYSDRVVSRRPPLH